MKTELYKTACDQTRDPLLDELMPSLKDIFVFGKTVICHYLLFANQTSWWAASFPIR